MFPHLLTITGTDSHLKTALLSRITSAEIVVEGPERLSLGDYECALEEFIEAVIDHPSVVGVYGDSVTPVAPGISDLDTSIVVEDTPRELEDLRNRVVGVLKRHKNVFKHGPVILPENAFEYLSLFANTTTYLDHVAGEAFSTAEVNDTVETLRFFDWLCFSPHCSLANHFVPKSPLRPNHVTNVPFISKAVGLVEPMLAAEFGIRRAASDVLHLNTRNMLSNAMSLRHRWNRFASIFDETPPGEEELIDQTESYRNEYFEHDFSVKAYIELLLNAFVLNHTINDAFIKRQSIYPSLNHSIKLRQNRPTIALQNWRSISPYRILKLFLDSRISGHVVPPETAVHLSFQPWRDKLFHGSPPAATIEDRTARSIIQQRNKGLRRYMAFIMNNDFDRDVFELSPMMSFLHHAAGSASKANSPRRQIKRRLRDVRNGVVTRSWVQSVNRDCLNDPLMGNSLMC